MLDTRLFSSESSERVHYPPPPQHLEDYHACLRLAQLTANRAHDREREGKAWFSSVLGVLKELDIELFEHSHRVLSYTPSDAVLKDVFEGWLAPPQSPSTRFRAVGRQVIDVLKSPDQARTIKTSSSTHLRIEFDREDNGSPVAILFHIACSNNLDAPRTRLDLSFDHLGARLDPLTFEKRRAEVLARIGEWVQIK